MKSLFLSLTLLGTISLQQVNAEEQLSSNEAAEIFHDSARASANKYCSEKDNGTSEQSSLDEAYYKFVVKIADEADTTPIVIHENLNEEDIDKFWNIFNAFAFEICPEYY